MSAELARLCQRIDQELDSIDIALDRTLSAWQHFEASQIDLYLDSVALNLHSLYSGFERIFEAIAVTIDGTRPVTRNWHQVLLEQMVTERPETRPAVISQSGYTLLQDYCRFRHVVRHNYSFQLEADKLQPLVTQAPQMVIQISRELQELRQWLQGFTNEGDG
ncbi:MAG: hypothetical protein VKK80_16930 [Prochlorothrix sp.]|nr:hypothetical protein [Prochlorothrix sp.]